MPNNTEYEIFVTSLSKPGQAIINGLQANDAHALHMAIGISGEAGELLDAIKKHAIYRKPLDTENVIEELGDLEFYMAGLRTAYGLSREGILEANVAKLQKRYPNASYSDTDAQQRADKAQ